MPRIAFIASGDPGDRTYSSGVYYYMAQALEKHCGDVHHIEVERPLSYGLGKAMRTSTRFFLGKNYDFLHSYRLAKAYARKIGRRLTEGNYDIVFAAEACTEIAFLDTDIPIIYLSDTTFALAVDYYPFYTNLLGSSLRCGNTLEAEAIKKACAIVYPTRWAARSAMKDYSAHESKVHVIPFGANLDYMPSREEALGRTCTGVCKLLLVGVDWVRKGANIALETLLELEKMGVAASLTVCGCTPPQRVKHPNLNVIPQLDKNDERQSKQLTALYLDADFLILPSRAENAAFVLFEAAACGLPVLASSTGGIPYVIRDGINGFVMPPDADGRAYAGKVREAFLDKKHYYELRRASRDLHEKELNWNAWGQRIRRIIDACLER